MILNIKIIIKNEVKMIKEETDYQNFILEFTKKSKELKEKFDNLSDNNKRRFYEEVKPLIDSGVLSWLFNQML